VSHALQLPAIKLRLQLVREIPPHLFADSRLRDRAEKPGEMLRRFLDKGTHALGSGVVERDVETFQCSGQLDSALMGLAELVTSLLFVFDELGEPVPNGFLCFQRALVA
jgi:hypothetical protein